MREIKEISVSHGPCFGQCPIDTLSILPSGTLLYAGEENVARIGHFTACFARDEWSHLCRLLDEILFWEQPEEVGGVDDWPCTTFRAQSDSEVKTVAVQALDWPYALWLLDSALNGFAALEQRLWKPQDSGVRGRLKNPSAGWNEAIIDREASPDAVLAVDKSVRFHAPLHEDGTFEIPLRPGRYRVKLDYLSKGVSLLVRPSAWQEIEMRDKEKHL
jgi:hypothetical protein